MSVKTPFCANCGHARRSHTPTGCTECECEQRAPAIVTRKDGTEVESWGDYTNRAPAFEGGNKAAVRHGATSPSLVSERSRAILEELVSAMPWLADADVVTVEALARAKAVFDPVDEYVIGILHGDVQAHPRKGVPRTGVEAVPDHVWRQWRGNLKLIIESAAKLGMNPVDRSALMRDTGWAKHLGAERIDELVRNGRARLAGRGR